MSVHKVTHLFLVDPITRREVVELNDGVVIDAALLARCELRPRIVGGPTGRVLWVVDGATLGRVFDAPFSPDAALAAKALTAGVRTIRAVPYAPPDDRDPKGRIGTSRTVRVTVTAGNVPSQEPRAKPLLLGLCADTVDPRFAGPAVMDLGARGMRLWCSMRDDQPPPADKFAQARFYKSLGLKVMFCCTGATLGEWYSPARVSTWFARAAALADGCVDGWEIGNEPNLRMYNTWPAGRYVREFVTPASVALRGFGQRIYSPSVTADVGYLKNLIAHGLLPLIDVLNVHVYQAGVQQHVDLLKRLRDLAPDLPLCESEFNINGAVAKPPLTQQQWADRIGPLIEGVRGVLDEAYLFVLNYHTHMPNAGLLDTRSNPPARLEPMYSAVKRAFEG